MNNKPKFAIIVAGGKGTRFGSEVPKQFLPIKNLPVLMHTITAFYNYDNNLNIIVVLPRNQIEYWNELCFEYNFKISVTLAAAGSTRFESVNNGLNTITATDGYVAIHDGVRPLVSSQVIANSFSTAIKEGIAVPVVNSTDSIRIINDDNSSSALNREKLRAVQTPQTFRLDIIRESYKLKYSSDFTDDASVAEAAGYKVTLFNGDTQNIKITHHIDLIIAEQFLDNE